MPRFSRPPAPPHPRRVGAPCALSACLLLGLCYGCSAQDQDQVRVSAQPGAEARQPAKPLTDAERVAQNERLLAEAKQGLADTTKALEDPASDYARADKDFKELDAKLGADKRAAAKLREAKQLDEAARAEAALKPLVADWEAARDQFNIAIAQRKALLEKRAALADQIAKLERTLDALKHPGPPDKAAPPPAKPEPQQPKPPDAAPVVPGVPGLPGLPGVPPPARDAGPARPAVPDDDEIRHARSVAEGRRAALTQAEHQSRSIEERARALQQLIVTEERLLVAERRVADHADQELKQLTERAGAAAPAERPGLLARLAAAQKRLADARGRIVALTDRVSSLNEDLHAVQDEQIQALQAIEASKKDAEDADRELTRLQNPFAVRNLSRWVEAHGANMVLIATGIAALYLAVRLSSRRIVRLVARNSHRGSDEDRENRASTLVGVFRYATNLALFGGGVVVLLDEAGIPVVPLMGGAAVLGLAVAFGAQNLIRDYFSGFMILLEDQYGVNDVVRIGGVAGLVENITLRVTVLRDLEGVLHFIPHGQVTAVSNMTHGWSRAQFDIPVPHDANLDFVMSEFVRLGTGLRADPAFGPKIVDDPEMLGVETLDATAVGVRFLVKTRPLQQWAVKRELLRRIKLRLDELGIGLPPPRQRFDVVQRTGRPLGEYEAPHRLWPGTESKTGT